MFYRMNLMVDIKENRFDSNMIVGGQLWVINKDININRIKNLLNIIGKSRVQVFYVLITLFSANDGNQK